MIEIPYYLVDETGLLRNLQLIEVVRERAGVRVLPTKCGSGVRSSAAKRTLTA